MNGTATLLRSDVLEWAKTYEGEPFMALLADPPYHLTSIVNRFKNEEPEHTKTAQDIKHRRTPHARQAAGFMGRAWDGGDIAFRPETWAALGKHLHPGAFMMCFAGTRGYHRMACAIEDAGFVIHPSIGWLFGSGFPKATRIKGDLAFDGHRYGLQAMKPSFEFIAVAQKPYKGKPQDCIKRTGAGALNIEEGRVGNTFLSAGGPTGFRTDRGWNQDSMKQMPAIEHEGRWPSNLALDEAGAEMVDRQSGVSGPSGIASGPTLGKLGTQACYGKAVGENMGKPAFYGDLGGASRFFHVSDWQAEVFEQIGAADAAGYFAKAGRVERDAGLDGMPRLQNADWPQSLDGGDARGASPRANNHPTVKPLRLNRWLASLLLPPAPCSPRRILNPFAGSGSEAIGALLAGWDEVVGIEREAEYHAICEARVKFWQGNVGLFEQLTAVEDELDAQQGFDL